MIELEIHEYKEKVWHDICEKYLPISKNDTIWRYSRNINNSDPNQGWKIHISATILDAIEIFKLAYPFLNSINVLFKAPKSLLELKKLNCGLNYGYSQIGKFITIYTRSSSEALYIAENLYKLTSGHTGVNIPYELSFQDSNIIYYRYGAFHTLKTKNSDGESISAIQTPDGKLIPDSREPNSVIPSWATNPFIKEQSNFRNSNSSNSLINQDIMIFKALSQRGKSAVFKALDLSVSPARLCIIKEGRLNGEVDWDKKDGYMRVKHEEEVLKVLKGNDIKVPKVYRSFTNGINYYLVMELIEGDNLQEISFNKKLPISKVISYGYQLAIILSKIHSAGFIWRDCKPLNIILNKEGFLQPLDFEGACYENSLNELPYGTNGYIPYEWSRASKITIHQDLYALGATLHQLLSGEIPISTELKPIGKLRKGVPEEVRKMISSLLHTNPNNRPDALYVSKILKDYI